MPTVPGKAVAVGKDTPHDYLGHLEDAFLLRSLAIATDSERRRRVNPRKVYPVDTGLIPLFDRSGKTNLGHALETAVLLQLERRGAETAYVRTEGGFEVDFFARHPDGREELLQVSASLDDPDTRAREIRALQDAATQYPRAGRRLIAFDAPPAFAMPRGITL